MAQSGLVIAWLGDLAGMRTLLLRAKATTGVVRLPSALGMMTGRRPRGRRRPSSVVLRSIPTALGMVCCPVSGMSGGDYEGPASGFSRPPGNWRRCWTGKLASRAENYWAPIRPLPGVRSPTVRVASTGGADSAMTSRRRSATARAPGTSRTRHRLVRRRPHHRVGPRRRRRRGCRRGVVPTAPHPASRSGPSAPPTSPSPDERLCAKGVVASQRAPLRPAPGLDKKETTEKHGGEAFCGARHAALARARWRATRRPTVAPTCPDAAGVGVAR
jgi:hypothetical protein